VTRTLVWESWAFDAWTAIEARAPALAERILLAIEQYVETGRGDVRKLTARGDLRRLRVGDWRVLFRHEHGQIGEVLVVVVAIADRRDAYRQGNT
jgi:mRNA-degrading endonuclease RelE of RelBE toxin-antitoxin system